MFVLLLRAFYRSIFQVFSLADYFTPLTICNEVFAPVILRYFAGYYNELLKITLVTSIIVFSHLHFIFIVHNILSYLVNHFTVPKVKDLVHSPAKRYESIYASIAPETIPIASSSSFESLPPPPPPVEAVKDMKEELKNFLKSQTTTTTTGWGWRGSRPPPRPPPPLRLQQPLRGTLEMPR